MTNEQHKSRLDRILFHQKATVYIQNNTLYLDKADKTTVLIMRNFNGDWKNGEKKVRKALADCGC